MLYCRQMASVISISHLQVVLGHGYLALDDVSVALPSGRITGIIGPSGAGKTTLIRTIVGRQRIRSGTVSVFGEPAGSKVLRGHVSYMTQEQSVYQDLSVAENVRYFAAMLGLKKPQAAVREVLELVDLQQKSGLLVSDLSGGQKQRVSLASALLGKPELLVLDEPTVGLDPVLREQLWELFRRLRDEGTTIIISSHVMDEAERCDDLLLVREGKLVAHGTPKGLCERTGTKSVEASFLKLAGKEAS